MGAEWLAACGLGVDVLMSTQSEPRTHLETELQLRAEGVVRLLDAREPRIAVQAGGWSLIVAAVGFMTVFTYLATRFQYPDVLDGKASDVLPALLTLGSQGRAVWIVYALLPLLLIPASIGIAAAFRHVMPNAMRALVVFGSIAATSMLLGLARWPTIHWEMAEAYASSNADARQALDVMFSGLNAYLGNFIGEFLGEIALNTVFALSGFALLRVRRTVAGYSGMAVAVIGIIASFRNITDTVAIIAEINNYVLPMWLIALGILLLRWRSTRETRL